MRTGYCLLVAATIITAQLLYRPGITALADEKDVSRIAVAEKLEKALSASESPADPEQQVALLKSAAGEMLRTMKSNVFVEDCIREVEQSKSIDPRSLAKEWRAALTESRDILRFEPLVEAPLPEGFPKPTPVGEIRVQQYPKYRIARTEIARIEGLAFWTLFNHIKQREIAMTAPVEMTYASDSDGATRKSAMSFLYRSVKQGRLGNASNVEVVDVPAQTALSIGIRGDATPERVADAKRRLEGWLVKNGDQYESSGVLRVLGYNSPFVADRKRFTEVQIPVIAK